MEFHKLVALPILISTLIVGCGGGGGSGSGGGTPTATTLTGVAASGAALAGARVSAKDVNGIERIADTSDDGSYELNLSGTTGPYVLRAISMDGSEYFSAALASDLGGIVNITPLTSIIVADATNMDPKVLYGSYGSPSAAALTANLAASITNLVSALAPVASAVGATLTETGVLRGAFSADHTGIDRMLDALQINFNGSVLSITDKQGNVIASSDMASSPLAIDPADVTAASGYLAEYANATAEISTFLAALSADCGTPQLDANNLGNDDLYTTVCTDHLAPAGTYLNEGIGNPAEFSPGWWQIAYKGGTVIFSNPIIFGYDATNGYKVRYNYVATAASRIGLFQSEGYFKKIGGAGGSWTFRGDQQYLLLDMNAHRYVGESSTGVDANAFKLFVSTGAGSWAATTYGGQPITYAVVTGPGLPEAGVTLSDQVTGPDNLPALAGCMPIEGNAIAVSPTICGGGTLPDVTFGAPDLIAPEGELGNMQRYVIAAYTGTVGSGTKLYEIPYWLPLRYEYVIAF